MLPTSSLVVERTKENLKAAGWAVRCGVIKGSFFESIPAGADAYLFRHIIHDWTDDQCIQILGHCRKVIPANAKLLIVDCVVPAGNVNSQMVGKPEVIAYVLINALIGQVPSGYS